MNLTAAVLLAALVAPALAESDPTQTDAQAQQQVEQDAVVPETTSRGVTPEEIERWGIDDLRDQIIEDFRVQQLENKPREFVRGPFLGVNAKPLDIDTAEELGLKRSTGLLVTYAPGNGPAGTAGLKKGDVLTKLNDQLLINAEQFAVLVRSQAIGDTVTLHGLRDGEPIKLEAKLGEADHALLGPGGKDLDQAWRVQLNPVLRPGNPLRPEVEVAPGLWIGDGWGGARIKLLDEAAMPEEIREMMEKIEQQMLQQRQDMDKRMQQLRKQLDLDIEELREGLVIPQGDGAVQKQLQATMAWSDGKHKIRISNNNGNSQLTIKDREDQVIYDGPLPEDGQVEGLPKDVQQKVDQLLNNTRIEQHILPKEKPEQLEEKEAAPQA
jgi:hypothetical protein